MRRLAEGTRLVVASHNQGKLREINELVRPFRLEVISTGSLNLAAPAETGRTFADNARIKALAAAQASGHPALADDSGLEVDVLDGAPGIRSARWAGPERDFALAMRKVADAVAARGGWATPGPRANFTCALCLAWADGEAQVFEGRVFGSLVWPSRGTRGFGYDPMFLPDGETLTFGEMDPAHKHAISHRARAFALFVANCLDAGTR
jgi:XTP/dITP diphosphohydrolase